MAAESVGVVMTDQTPVTPDPTVAVRLRPGLRFIPQRGSQDWRCIVEIPQQQRFVRIGRREYLIASALDGHGSVQSIVDRLTARHPHLIFDVATVDQTIRWLINSGLTESTKASDAPIESKTKAVEAKPSSLPDPFMFRIPILRGEVLLEWLGRVSFLCSRTAVMASLLVIFAGLICLAMNSDQFARLSVKLFVPTATFWWIGAWFVLKVIHELGHAVVCATHGGQVRTSGIAFLYLAPVPFVDTTDMWRLPERRVRAYCAAGGMWSELVAASIAVFVCQIVEIPSIQYFCVSIVMLGTFTTLAFNANPLVRFDGYYILSDLLNRPNLWTEGQIAVKKLWQTSGSGGTSPSLLMVGYGLACFLNRILLLIGLAWGAWITYRGIGVGLIALASYLWFVRPMLQQQSQRRKLALLERLIGQKLSATPTFAWRRCAFMAVAIACFACLSLWIRSPLQPLSPGYLSYGDSITLRPKSDGIVAEVYEQTDTVVEAGAPILRLENPKLSLEEDRLRCSLALSQERCLVLRAQGRLTELQVEQAKAELTRQQLEQVTEQIAQLVLTAPERGRLISRTLHNSLGRFAKVGQPLADIAGTEAVQVICSVAQDDVESYRQQVGGMALIYLSNHVTLSGKVTEVRPRGSDTLENPALAAKFGGPITVHLTTGETDQQKNPLKTQEPRFEARLEIDSLPEKPLTPGQLCRVSLVNRKLTIAGVLDRWKDSLIEWIKPIEPKS